MSVLTLEQVTMKASAGIVEILKDISFSVEPGEFVALVGASGAGKTSLLRVINRLAETASGTIRLEGQNIQKIPVVDLRRQVALVNQESRLLGMTVEETLGYSLRLRGVKTKKTSEAIAQWSERLNIPADWMSRTAVNLSMGQRQRVAIARTLIAEPKVLLLDEPTSSQDVGYSEFLLSRLAEWAKQKKFTVIMANHQIDLAARYVDRMLHISDGRLTEDLSADKVNWTQLRQALVAAEQQAEAEWS